MKAHRRLPLRPQPRDEFRTMSAGKGLARYARCTAHGVMSNCYREWKSGRSGSWTKLIGLQSSRPVDRNCGIPDRMTAASGPQTSVFSYVTVDLDSLQ
jgi:hypothetical protein